MHSPEADGDEAKTRNKGWGCLIIAKFNRTGNVCKLNKSAKTTVALGTLIACTAFSPAVGLRQLPLGEARPFNSNAFFATIAH